MKKRVQLLLSLAILLLVGGLLMLRGNQKIQLELDGDNNLSLLLTSDHKQQRINLWYDESDGRYYFFLPAYCRTKDICFPKLEENTDLLLNGISVQSGDKFKWQEETVYCFEIQEDNTVADYDIIFLRSANLPAVFVATDSGDMKYIHQDKENEEEGSIDIVTADGNVEYSGRLSKISGRGNSTWDLIKKPYSIKLREARPLLGMKSGDKWCLLAGFREGTNLNNKVAFDMAELLGLNYSTQCTWIDLYLNGEYAGIYLLAESVSVGAGRVEIDDLEKQNKAGNPNMEEADTFEEGGMKGYIIDDGGNISGGYLFEKDHFWYWEEESVGFTTLRNNTFTIKSPRHASREQVEYLSQYVQSIDNMLNDGNTEYRNYIDFESFARKFIVDEIALSYDVNVTSMFYYKKPNDDLLYAGPVWDFDGAFGEGNAEWLEGNWVNYEYSSTYFFRDEEFTLNWYAILYDDEAFRSRVIELYSDALLGIEELIETKIDIYADYIRKSVELDRIRWDYQLCDESPGHYVEFDNNVRYLKFFLAQRLNYLNKKWDVDYRELPLPNTEDTHEITFWLDGELIETREVADGETLTPEELPHLEEDYFYGWYFTHSDERYWIYLPIYEDTDFYARRR